MAPLRAYSSRARPMGLAASPPGPCARLHTSYMRKGHVRLPGDCRTVAGRPGSPADGWRTGVTVLGAAGRIGTAAEATWSIPSRPGGPEGRAAASRRDHLARAASL